LNSVQPTIGTSGGTLPSSPSASSRLTDAHRRLCKRLSPLLSIEATLTRKLLSIPEFAPVPPSLHAFSADPSGSSDRQQQQQKKLAIDTAMAQRALTVRAGSGWKRILQLATRAPECSGSGNGAGTSPRRPPTGDRNRDDPTGALAACRQDIISLWQDPVLREVLKERGVRPENASGFFLDDVERIAVHNYEPTPGESRGLVLGLLLVLPRF
jgi:guanine nucleotide-binding protein alpha-1 subunit